MSNSQSEQKSGQSFRRREGMGLDEPEEGSGQLQQQHGRGRWTGRRPRSNRVFRKGRSRPYSRAEPTRTTATETAQLQKKDGKKVDSEDGQRHPKGRQKAVHVVDERHEFERTARHQDKESSGGGGQYSETFIPPSKVSVRHPIQGRGYAKKLRGIGRGSKSDGRFEVTFKDKHELSIQSGELTEQLLQGSYDCVVCCDAVGPKDSVWNCSSCYHIFHLRCIQKWARSPAASTESDGADGGKNWRCPCCQNSYQKIPSVYYCFCGKVKNPSHNSRDSYGYVCPHSCGDICRKHRDIEGCTHRCTMLCHPGPCPQCPVVVDASCPCGRTVSRVRCSQVSQVSCCGKTCGKRLSCGRHFCSQRCHTGACQPCGRTFSLACYCGRMKQIFQCSSKRTGSLGLSCHQPCGTALQCGNHCCEQECHRGACTPCSLLPSLVLYCPCGRMEVSKLMKEPRVSCLDPIPKCDNVCGRQLPCGWFHFCESKCHTGPCPPCGGVSQVKCQCGQTVQEIPCRLFQPNEVVLCDRLCNKKKGCGRHRCNQRCCTDTEHLCLLPCNKLLRCGIHRCEERCHLGHCPRCYNAGFEELTCHCGAQVIYPPIPCGTSPPVCDQPCSRMHDCFHPALHNCHNEEVCPPCPVLVSRMCMGGHRNCVNVPCHAKKVSCGSACGRLLTCGQHFCKRLCHEGVCLDNGVVCTSPCPLLRPCGHPCQSPCHPGDPCPTVVCRVKVKVICNCGRKSDMVPCLAGGESGAGFASLSSEDLAMFMRQLELGQPVDVEATLCAMRGDQSRLKCDEECAQWQRNRLLAAALNIDEANLSAMVSVVYSPFLQEKARREPEVTGKIEEEFRRLVEKVRKSGEKCSYSFPVMKKDHRQIIHELASYYNFRSLSYDTEPRRNVVVTASRDSLLPYPTLMAAVKNSEKPNSTA